MSAGGVNPDLNFSLRRVTERAACAAFNWIGRGDNMDGGRAALDAMRQALADVDIDAVVVIGEAGPGEAPQPTRGEHLGRPAPRLRPTLRSIPWKARATSCGASPMRWPSSPWRRAAP